MPWKPRAGWNAAFSNQNREDAEGLFFFFKNKGIPEERAENLAMMFMFKQIYHGLHYSEEQEAALRSAMRPAIPKDAVAIPKDAVAIRKASA